MAKSKMTEAWWKQSKEDACQVVFETVKFLKANQDWRQKLNLIHMRLYQNMKNMGLDVINYASFGDVHNTYNKRLTLNVVEAGIDTLVNRIGKDKPKVTFLTDDGSHSEKRRARQLSKFMNGAFHQTNLYDHTGFAFLDGCVFGTGSVYPYRVKGNIYAERVWSNELYVDDIDGAYREPRQIFRAKSIPRSVVKATFPEHAAKIEKATRVDTSSQNRYIADNIEVIEAVHLPSGKDATDGKRIICIESTTLLWDDWKYDYLPYVFWRYKNRLLGFWGKGVAETLSTIQLEIDRTIQVIQKSLRTCSVPRVYLQKGSGIIPSHINNEVGSIVNYTGQPPIFDVARAVSPELANHLENLYRKAFELIGVSQLAAQAKKPSGLDAGVALREFDDIESERHAILTESYQQFHVDIANRYIDLMDEMAEEKQDYEVKVKVDGALNRIKWSKIRSDRDHYVLEGYPTSLLPKRPQGRLQTVTEMTQAGYFSKEESMELLDFPDIKSVMDRKNAPLRIMQKLVDKMLDADEDDASESYTPPEPYMNLQFGIKYMQEMYLLAKMDNAEDFKLQLMRDWIDQAESMMQQSMQPPAPQQQPLANPQVPPRSDLVPLDTAQAPTVQQ